MLIMGQESSLNVDVVLDSRQIPTISCSLVVLLPTDLSHIFWGNELLAGGLSSPGAFLRL